MLILFLWSSSLELDRTWVGHSRIHIWIFFDKTLQSPNSLASDDLPASFMKNSRAVGPGGVGGGVGVGHDVDSVS